MSKKIDITLKAPALNRLTAKFHQAFKEKLKPYFQTVDLMTVKTKSKQTVYLWKDAPYYSL